MSRVSLLGNCNCSSEQLVAASLFEERFVTALHLLATVDAVVVSEQVLAQWELRQVDLRDGVLVIVPIFHAMLEVFVFHGFHSSRYAAMTEWFIILGFEYLSCP